MKTNLLFFALIQPEPDKNQHNVKNVSWQKLVDTVTEKGKDSGPLTPFGFGAWTCQPGAGIEAISFGILEAVEKGIQYRLFSCPDAEDWTGKSGTAGQAAK